MEKKERFYFKMALCPTPMGSNVMFKEKYYGVEVTSLDRKMTMKVHHAIQANVFKVKDCKFELGEWWVATATLTDRIKPNYYRSELFRVVENKPRSKEFLR